MLLEKIILENFRPFYGKQEISISTDEYKNFTLIHAKNGVGKTTLLNVLSWCFYRKTTAGFERNDDMDILNEQAASEGIYEAKVAVYFQHDENSYMISRSINPKERRHDFDAHKIENGDFKKINEPDLFIKSLVPKEMSEYFFSDGEYAVNFSRHGNRKEVKTALEKMLGCETAMDAISDLTAVKRNVDEKLGQLTQGNEQAEAYQKEVDRLKGKLEDIKDNINSLNDELDLEKIKQEGLENSLRDTAGAELIQRQRDEFKKQESDLGSAKKKVKTDLTKWISEYSIGLFKQKVIDKYNSVEQKGKLKGHIPSRISTGLVEEILEEKSCICGRTFEERSKEEKEIQKLFKESGDEVMSDRLMGINKCIERLDIVSAKAWDEFQKLDTQLKEIESKIDEIQLKIRGCDEELSQSNVSEIRDKQAAKKECEARISEIDKELAVLEKNRKDCLKKIKESEDRRNKHMSMDQQSRVIQFQSELLSKTIDYLHNELEIYRKESRLSITDRINEILKKTARRNYIAKINENFDLDLFLDNSPKPRPKSGGENQLLSLAFLASLVNFAANRIEEVHHLLKPGAMAPLVLDSPFGQLDGEYRESVAIFLPELCRQVVLLATETQSDPNVLKVIEEKIGAEYVLISENKDSNDGDKPLDVIKLKDREIQCSIYDGEKDRTVIEKIR